MKDVLALVAYATLIVLATALWQGSGVHSCETYVLTFYSVEQFPGRTADGTPTQGGAGWLAAGSYNLALGTVVWVDGFGTRIIADRGRLGARHLDLLVATTAEALRLGRQRALVCLLDAPIVAED